MIWGILQLRWTGDKWAIYNSSNADIHSNCFPYQISLSTRNTRDRQPPWIQYGLFLANCPRGKESGHWWSTLVQIMLQIFLVLNGYFDELFLEKMYRGWESLQSKKVLLHFFEDFDNFQTNISEFIITLIWLLCFDKWAYQTFAYAWLLMMFHAHEAQSLTVPSRRALNVCVCVTFTFRLCS